MKRPILRPFARSESGSAAIEFALVAPVLMLVLGGIADIGLAGALRLSLDSRLTSAAGAALLQPAPADAAAATSLAANLIRILDHSAADIAAIDVNNAATARLSEGVVTAGPGAGSATACYCPTRTGDVLTWGPVQACGTPCSGGDTAGRFVELRLSAPHVVLFAEYGFVEDGRVGASAVVRLP